MASCQKNKQLLIEKIAGYLLYKQLLIEKIAFCSTREKEAAQNHLKVTLLIYSVSRTYPHGLTWLTCHSSCPTCPACTVLVSSARYVYPVLKY